jgi:hypothetical protein
MTYNRPYDADRCLPSVSTTRRRAAVPGHRDSGPYETVDCKTFSEVAQPANYPDGLGVR